ncbi:Domain of unknown function DUF1906 [Catenulispora acidiphila DSM 44928]|uniref:DUF1906 domain-containing protein n=1 Tax=Catenulispora acidiphila (strain DSM 44928 / JCM 14897 / NBRC 102108 / NRRL B-24433 / ID139908) TaxID=479433 RepID=C7QFZ2_CATAD|nr:Domain of unknown function DUF1906 [Catenulispora acidiphila DSM 44928]
MVPVTSSILDDPRVSRRRLLTSACAAAVVGVTGVRPASATTAAPVANGLDYASAPHPSVGAMAAAGYAFVVRYLSYSPEKNLTADEARALTSAGIAVVCNWEATADGPRQGFARGVADATEADKQAAACGSPADRPIYFSIDWDVQAADMDAVNAYFDGVASVIGVARTGAYSSYDALGWLLASGRIQWAWQSCSTAYSNGRNRTPYPGIQLWQNRTPFTFDGADVDGDQALTADFGQWGAGAFMEPQGSGGRIAGGVHSDGRIELFAVTPSGGITNAAETAPNGVWSGWSDFSPAKGFGFAARTSSVAVGRHADGRLEVFAVMSDGSVQNRFQDSAGGAWSDWGVFASSKTAKALTVVAHADGRLELFAATPTGGISNKSETTPNGAWSGWNEVGPQGGVTETVSAARHADGRLEVFAVMSDGSMRNRVETAANGAWSAWGVYGPTGGANGYGAPGTVAAGAHQDGRVEVFAVTPGGGVRNRFEAVANGAEWSRWGDGFGPAGPVTAASVTRHADGRMAVFAVLADGSIWNRSEAVANGAWSEWNGFVGAGMVKP